MGLRYLTRCLLAAGLVWAGAANAQEQVATFTGKVTADACTVSVNGSGSKDGTVTFEPVLSNNQLLWDSSYAAETSFTLDLSDCGLSSGTMRAHFYNAEAGAVSNGRLNKTDPTGTGSGWQIQLLSKNNKLLHFYTSPTIVKKLSEDPGGWLDAAGGTRIEYKVRYFRQSINTKIIPGTLRGHATYVLYYN